MTRPALLPPAVLAAVAAPDSIRSLLRPPSATGSGVPTRAGSALAERAAEVIDQLSVRRTAALPTGAVDDALGSLPTAPRCP